MLSGFAEGQSKSPVLFRSREGTLWGGRFGCFCHPEAMVGFKAASRTTYVAVQGASKSLRLDIALWPVD